MSELSLIRRGDKPLTVETFECLLFPNGATLNWAIDSSKVYIYADDYGKYAVVQGGELIKNTCGASISGNTLIINNNHGAGFNYYKAIIS